MADAAIPPESKNTLKIIPTSRGADLVRGGATLSEVLRAPEPTHSVFDVLAAAIDAFAPVGNPANARVALLGFAGGALVAPLRAMGSTLPLRCVDIDLTGHEVFERLCSSWAGAVQVHAADAVTFLRRQRKPFDMIIDDLSVLGPKGETKPEVSVDPLPQLMRDKLKPGGVAITNLLDMPKRPLVRLEQTICAPWRDSVSVHVSLHVNRVLISADKLPGSREINRRLNARLDEIGSELHCGIQVRRVPPASR